VATEIHLTDPQGTLHIPVPCFANPCVANEHIGPAGSKVHDKATVTSSNPTLNPTGSIRFLFYTNLHCQQGGPFGLPVNLPPAAISAFGGVGTAESISTAALAVGEYSYRTSYVPDAAAAALGFHNNPGPCEQLRIIKVRSGTSIHFGSPADAAPHASLPCYDAGCIGQTAPVGSVIHDLDSIDSTDTTRPPTGYVRFGFYEKESECRGRPTSFEDVTVVIDGGNSALGTAESSSKTLAAGDYSYKAIYFPDAAAKAFGLGASPANCEQLRITPVETPIP
jgi:hypothetical protein